MESEERVLAGHPMHARRAATRGAVVMHMMVMTLSIGHGANVMNGLSLCQRSARKWLQQRYVVQSGRSSSALQGTISMAGVHIAMSVSRAVS